MKKKRQKKDQLFRSGKESRSMRKISVIIFCHNVGAYIDRCIASIAVQTIGMDDLEIICVDDASSDDTWA